MSVSTAPLTTEAAGERRYLTVMFCNLDSARIAARLNAANLFAQNQVDRPAVHGIVVERDRSPPFYPALPSYLCRLTEGKCAHVEHIAEAQ